MIVTAVVVIGGRPDDLDPLTPVGAQPMVARAVRCLLDSGLVERVLVLDRLNRADAVLAACRGLPVSVRAGNAPAPVRTHVDQRGGAGTGDGSLTSRSSEVVLLHDAARPLAPPELAVAVVQAVHNGCCAAVPVLPMADTVKQVDDSGLVRDAPDRAALRVVQTPQAIRRELLTDPPLHAALQLAESGGRVCSVPGHARAFAVRTGWDLERAQLLAGSGAG
jgi:2-C-methyl-D-erythritol 4-phosphate cytidylyltransferase